MPYSTFSADATGNADGVEGTHARRSKVNISIKGLSCGDMSGKGRLRNASIHPTRLGIFLIACFCFFPSISTAQAPSFLALASTDQKRVQLSEAVRVVVTIAGPAPLIVEPPKQLLVPESDRDWRIRPVGRSTIVPVLGLPGWECWLQVYRLDPYITGNALHIDFSPLKVNKKEVAPPGFEVTVLSSLTEVKPENARPVTGIEELPPPPIVDQSTSLWWVLLASALMVVGLVYWRFRSRPKPISPDEWARKALDRLEHEGGAGAALVEGVSTVLRGFIDRRFGIPAPRLTTSEALIAAEQAGWPVEVAESLGRLLEVCDRAKFAGDIPGDEGCRHLLAGGRDWINRVSSDSRPG